MNNKNICVIGGGLSGILLSYFILKSSKHKVKIIDIDTLESDFSEKRSDFDQYPFKEFDLLTRGFGFGGTSNLWHGVLADFDAIDFDRIEKQCGKIDWLLNAPNQICYEILPGLKNFYLKDCYKANTKYLSEYFTNEWEEKRYLIPKYPLRAKDLLKDLIKIYKERVELVDNSVAIKINYSIGEDGLKKADYVLVSRNNKNEKVNSDIFISCLGALETPRLLMQSFLNDQYNMNYLGKGLLEHPYAIISKIKYKKSMPSVLGQNSFFSKNKIRYGFRPKKLFYDRNPALGIVPERKSIKELFKKKFNNKSFNQNLNNQKDSFLAKEIAGASIPYIKSKLGFNMKTRFHEVIYHHEVLQSDGGEISLRNEIDSYGRFKVDYKYPSLNYFYEQVLKLQELLKSDKKFNSENHVENIHLKDIKIFPGSHYAGTCRMSFDKKNGICDNNLKIHDSQNIYVCDPSIFPVIGSANLGLSILKASFHLAKCLNI